jgi:subtilisin-like proprotein convertase family protein
MNSLLAKIFAAAALAWCGNASAALFYDYSGSSVAIPDNSGTGIGFGFSLSDPAASITSVTVTLNISGGYNGDLYAYLSHGSGFAVLLNRTGVGSSTPGSSSAGYADTGFAITLGSSAAANVHFYQNNSPTYNVNGQLTGTWRPDGRGIDPELTPSAFDASGSADFSTFTGLNPNGNWTLFLADLSGGSISTLDDFSVSVTAVPEPLNVGLAVFAGIFFLAQVWRRRRTGE